MADYELSYTGAQIDTILASFSGVSTEVASLTDVEVQQLQNIGTSTISAAQWGYLGAMAGQPLESGSISDTVYGSGWNAVTSIAPSKNAVYDIISTTITDLDGFPDELKNLVTAEIQQLENIGDRTISYLQWGYLGGLDQALDTGQSPTFVALDTDKILSDSFTLKGAADSETLATFAKDGAVVLYYDNSAALQTTSDGIDLVNPAGSQTVSHYFSTDNYVIKNENNSGTLNLLGKNSGGSNKYILSGDPDGNTIIYDAGTAAITTASRPGITVGTGTPAVDFGGGTLSMDDIGISNIIATSGADANIAEKPNFYLERTANATGANLALGWGNDNQEAIMVIHGQVGDASENGLTGFVSKVQSWDAENAASSDANTLHGGLIVAETEGLSGYTHRHMFGLGIQAVLHHNSGTLASGQNLVCIEADVNTDQDLDGGAIGAPTYNATGYWAQAASTGNPTAAFRATYASTGYWGYGLLMNTYFTKCGIYVKNGNAGVQGMYLETEYASGFVAKFVNEGNNANRYGLEIQAGADDGSGTTYYIQALDGDGNAVGYLQHSGDFSAVNPSDARIKSRIRKTKIKGLEIINDIPVKDFTKRGHRLTGFVAQDVLSVWPQAVSEDPTGMLGVSRESLVPVLAKAVQELYAKVEKMKGKKNVKRKSVRST